MFQTFLSSSRLYRLRLLGFSLCCLVLSALVIAQPVRADQPTIPQVNYAVGAAFPIEVGTQMLFVEDPEHTLSAAQAMANSNLNWQEIHKASPNFGFTQSAFWFRFDVVNVVCWNSNEFDS